MDKQNSVMNHSENNTQTWRIEIQIDSLAQKLLDSVRGSQQETEKDRSLEKDLFGLWQCLIPGSDAEILVSENIY